MNVAISVCFLVHVHPGTAKRRVFAQPLAPGT